MFSLFVGLWEFLFSKAELHLLIVGLDDAGKTVGTCVHLAIGAACPSALFLTMGMTRAPLSADAAGAA
jgi:hypothetical protein